MADTYIYRRGVNAAGADFGSRNSPSTGTYDSDASFAFYASRGHKLIRVPFLWEHIQPTLGGALDTGELGRLTAAVNSCTSRGMAANIDVHNYARYMTADGVNHVITGSDGVVTQAHLTDLWTRLANAFMANPLVQFGIMNEPYSLPAMAGTVGANLVTNTGAETDTSGWSANGGTVARVTNQFHSGAASFSLTCTTASTVQMNGPQVAASPGQQFQIGTWLKAGTTGRTGFIQMNWLNSTGGYMSTSAVGYAGDVTTGWTQETGTVTAPSGCSNAQVIVGLQNMAVGEVHYVDDVTAQVVTGGKTDAQVWEGLSQAAVTAIRSTGATNFIWVSPTGHGAAAGFWNTHPNSWITDSANNFGYEGHYYFNSKTDGSQATLYSDANANAVAQGYADLPSKIRSELGGFTNGAVSRGVKCYLGECGWQNTGSDIAQWNAAGDVAYQIMDTAQAPVTYWAAGEQWGTTYALSAYTGTPQSALTGVSSVIEAHPSLLPLGAALGATSSLTVQGVQYSSAALVATSSVAMSKMSTLVDTFAGPAVSPLWNNNGCSIVNSQLQVPNTTAYNSLTSASAYDITNSAMSVQTYAPGDLGDGTRQNLIKVVSSTDSTTWMGFTVGGGSSPSLTAVYSVGGVTNYTGVGGIPVNGWVRLRHAGSTVYWDSSPDGVAWTNVKMLAASTFTGWSLTSCLVVLQSGYYGTNSAVSYGYFDNLNSGVPSTTGIALGSTSNITTALNTTIMRASSRLAVATSVGTQAGTAALVGVGSAVIGVSIAGTALVAGGSLGTNAYLITSSSSAPNRAYSSLTAVASVRPSQTQVFTPVNRINAVQDALIGVVDYTWAIGPWNSLPTIELPSLSARTITWRVLGNNDATFTIDSQLTETPQIQELISDLWILRNGVPLFRGRVGPTSDTTDGVNYTSTINAIDYREVLRRRLLLEGDQLTWSNTDQAQVAWGLIQQTQKRAGGDLGISQGLGQHTGVLLGPSSYVTSTSTLLTGLNAIIPGLGPTQTTNVVLGQVAYAAGSTIGANIDQISQTANGFDYDINMVTLNGALTTGLSFDIYYPTRGTNKQEVLDHPGRIVGFTRNADPTVYANTVRMTGNTGLAAVLDTAPDIATRPEGRWDAQVGDTSILTAGAVAARAAKELTNAENFMASWQVVLAPNVWQGPNHIWLGDTITLVVQAGRLNVVESLPVMEIQVALDDSGVETVTLTLGAPRARSRASRRRIDMRLTALERR